jgi:hypothetical protein
MGMYSLIADTLLAAKPGTYNPDCSAQIALTTVAVLKNSTDPDDWDRVKKLDALVKAYLWDCVNRVMRDAGHPWDQSA